mgnify:FL=1
MNTRNACWCIVITLLSGCSGESVPGLVPVEGRLTFQGKPVVNKSVRFVPMQATGISSQGQTDSDGKFRLLAIVSGAMKDHPGIPPGRYRVVVVDSVFSLAPANSESSDGAMIPGLVASELPTSVQSEATSTLFADVPANGGTIDLEIPSP